LVLDFIGRVDRAQGAYMRAKAGRERAAAEAEAEQRRHAAQQAAMPRSPRRSDLFGDDIIASLAADEAAQEATKRAAGPVADLVRSRSALGTTTTLKRAWVWRLRKGGLMELATAVARGEAPLVFLTTNDAVIGAAVRGKDGVRHVPGPDHRGRTDRRTPQRLERGPPCPAVNPPKPMRSSSATISPPSQPTPKASARI